RAEVLKLGVHLAQQQVAFVALVQEGVGHVGGDVIGLEINRDDLVVPEQLAMAHVQPADREGEQALQRVLGRRALQLGLGLVGSAIGIENNVNDRMIENYGTETKFCSQRGDDFDVRDQAVHVGIGNVAWLLQAMDGE